MIQQETRFKKRFCNTVSDDPFAYIEVALALETLAYHNKNYLSEQMRDECTRSEEMQLLLSAALQKRK